ncbi:MAG: hypothetical protein KDA73_08240 [Rhodobacteraceae bacterium]|nr:hypothetical protein [Paracoccaceae bacterium]
MRNAPAARVAVGDTEFIVRHNSYRAEAVRTSAAAHPTVAAMLLRARAAMETASGCTVRPGTLYGDAVLSEAFLDCPGQQPARLQPRWIYSPPG